MSDPVSKPADKMILEELRAALEAARTDANRQFYHNWIDYRTKSGFYARPDQQ